MELGSEVKDTTPVEAEISSLLGYEPAFGISTGWDPALRRDYGLAVAEAARSSTGNIELSALSTRDLPALEAYLASGAARGALSRFQHCSVHGPAKHLPEGERAWKELVARLSGLPQAFAGRIVLHPDTLPSCAFEELRDLGSRLVLENMDCRKSSCRTVAELAPIFEELPEARFCFDVAHAWSVDRSLTEGQWLLDAFGERLCQVHCSGIGADGKHRPTEPRDLELYSELLAQCRDLPWVLESPWSSPGGVTAPPGQSSS